MSLEFLIPMAMGGLTSLIVYNIMTWKEPRVILGKIFDIFDTDEVNKITRSEMERVLNDLAGLFKDKRAAKDCFVNTFQDMDQNYDNEIARDEFIVAVLEDKKYIHESVGIVHGLICKKSYENTDFEYLTRDNSDIMSLCHTFFTLSSIMIF